MERDVTRVEIQKPQGHGCFACGTDNPIGLHLSFFRTGEAVSSNITLGKHYEGWENIAHGGIISTLLDEIMSWAVMVAKKTYLVTRKMDIKYVRNVAIGTPLTVTGRMVDDTAPPKIRATGEIRDDHGRLLVRGSAEFVAVPEDKFAMPASFKSQMASLFASME